MLPFFLFLFLFFCWRKVYFCLIRSGASCGPRRAWQDSCAQQLLDYDCTKSINEVNRLRPPKTTAPFGAGCFQIHTSSAKTVPDCSVEWSGPFNRTELQPFQVDPDGSNLPPPPREPSIAHTLVAVAVAPNFYLFFLKIWVCYVIHKNRELLLIFSRSKKIMNYVLRSNQNSRTMAARGEKKINNRDPKRLLDLRFYS